MNLSEESRNILLSTISAGLDNIQASGSVETKTEEATKINNAENDYDDESDESYEYITDEEFFNRLDESNQQRQGGKIIQGHFGKRENVSQETQNILQQCQSTSESTSPEKIAELNSTLANSVADDIINPESNKGYFTSDADKRIPTPIECSEATMSDSDLNSLISRVTDPLKKKTLERQKAYRTQTANQSFQRYCNPEQVQRKEKREYSKGSISIGDKTFDISKVYVKPLWEDELKGDLSENVGANLDTLSRYITDGVLNEFGYNRINSIYIVSDNIIVNNTAYRPILDIDMSKFPADMAYYVQNGCLAYFLDWNKIKKSAKNINSLGFDSMQYVITKVGADWGLGRRITKTDFYNCFHNLYDLTIGSESITIDDFRDKSSEKSAKMSKSLAKAQRSAELHDSFGTRLFAGWKPQICSGTDYMQNFMGNSFKSYLENRGNKGFLRYSGGVLLRGFGALSATAVNGVTHLVKGIFGVFHDAMTPVTDEDING